MRRTAFKNLLIITVITGVVGCSVNDAITLATSKNPKSTFRSIAKSSAESSVKKKVGSQSFNEMLALAKADDPNAFIGDKAKVFTRSIANKLLTNLLAEAGIVWGKREAIAPSNKRYVKYTENYKSRAIVHFDKGLITVETLDQQQSIQSLQRAIVSTLLTPDDPRAVDLYSAKTIKLTGRPYLHGLVEDQKGRSVDEPVIAESYAQYLIKNRYKTRTTQTQKGSEQVHFVQFKMVSDYQNRQAQNYKSQVDQYSKRYGVSKSLIYAVMKTESAFNPFAVSSAPAYGLMQIVPTTAGIDAFEYVKGYKHTPSKEYLFNSSQNIELGTAYLHIVDSRYLAKIKDPVKREYATISAYNGGAGNVFKTFSKDRSRAADIINQLSAAEVYRKLRDEHPRDETRRYLTKVLDARRQFINI
ncbi:MAG: murein transglycosylase domain-containing protein [Gammaproteobacteria bacterium]|nr:murein transglycosylase domain-containing protein [Gammaproteobacteria bacterium]